jgi:hypothetical protein
MDERLGCLKKTLPGGVGEKNSKMSLQPYLLIFVHKYDGALRILKLVRIRPKPKLFNPIISLIHPYEWMEITLPSPVIKYLLFRNVRNVNRKNRH